MSVRGRFQGFGSGLALVLALLLGFGAPLAVASPAASGAVVGGVDHVGLTVSDLTASEAFFVKGLGFRITRRDPAYPASFLTNGHVIVTLWRAADPPAALPFDRRNQVGLHHLAFAVESFEVLDMLHRRLARSPGVTIEFAPEPLSGGPARHMMIREPSGNRLEFIHRPPESPRPLESP